MDVWRHSLKSKQWASLHFFFFNNDSSDLFYFNHFINRWVSLTTMVFHKPICLMCNILSGATSFLSEFEFSEFSMTWKKSSGAPVAQIVLEYIQSTTDTCRSFLCSFLFLTHEKVTHKHMCRYLSLFVHLKSVGWRIEKFPLFKKSSQQDSKRTNETLWIVWDHVSDVCYPEAMRHIVKKRSPINKCRFRTMPTFSFGQRDGCCVFSFFREIGRTFFPFWNLSIF